MYHASQASNATEYKQLSVSDLCFYLYACVPSSGRKLEREYVKNHLIKFLSDETSMRFLFSTTSYLLSSLLSECEKNLYQIEFLRLIPRRNDSYSRHGFFCLLKSFAQSFTFDSNDTGWLNDCISKTCVRLTQLNRLSIVCVRKGFRTKLGHLAD